MCFDWENCQPSEAAVVKGETYRFTILTPAMIRLEYSETGAFVDSPTQIVSNRRFPTPTFHVEETNHELQIVTDYLRLRYNKKEFSPTGLQIRVNGQRYPHSAVWHYGDESHDLLGTARTLDNADGSIPLEHRVLSAAEWSLLDDSGTLLISENGWVEKRTDKSANGFWFWAISMMWSEPLPCLAQSQAFCCRIIRPRKSTVFRPRCGPMRHL